MAYPQNLASWQDFECSSASVVLAAWVRGICIRLPSCFAELPVERHEELIRRAMRWPDPLADQVARVLRR
jgi:hypothetical protein